MKYALMISAALLMAVGQGQPASAQSPTDLVKQAVDALGGADALRAVKTLVTKADAKHWEPGQSNSVNGESRFLGDSTLTTAVDYATPSVRFDWDRDMKYPAVEKLKYSEIRYPTYGAVASKMLTTRPGASTPIAPQRRGSGSSRSSMVAIAPARACAASSAGRSRPATTLAFITSSGPGPNSGRALANPPPVPSRSVSTE